MSDMMTFPDTWEEFEKSYGFTDNEEVYTNGARLIPSFRVKQWLDHLPSVQPEFSNNSKELEKNSKELENKNGELISREYAIDDLHGRDPSQIWDTADIEVWLNALPSVQPRKGKWAGKGDSEGFGIFICNNCGKFAMMEYDFCPNCGFRMEEGDSDD